MDQWMPDRRSDDLAYFMALHPHVLWTADAQGRAVQVGATWRVATNDAPASEWERFIHEEDLPVTLAAWSKAVSSGEPYDIEHRFRGSSGEYRWVRSRAKPFRGADGTIHKWYGSSEDIHDKKLLELKLKAQQEDATRRLSELEVLYRTAPIGLAVFDRELRFLRINDHLAAINGFPAEAHIGKTPAELVPDLAEQASALLHRILETGEPQLGVEIVGETPAQPGVKHAWLENWQPIPGPDGTPEAISIVAVDISERKRLEDELKADREKKAHFLAMVAHELRNPLAPMVTSIALLKRDELGAAPKAELLAVLERSCRQLETLVRDLLDLTETEGTQVRLSLSTVSVRDALDAAQCTAKRRLDARQQSLVVRFPAPDITVQADPVRLQQMLYNLLSNSSKYSGEGSAIALSARRDAENVVFRVEDPGIGIAADRLESVFELFSRGDHPWHAAVDGLGIGLALVRRLAEAHGGSVRAFSAGPGCGAAFEVTLPLSGP